MDYIGLQVENTVRSE